MPTILVADDNSNIQKMVSLAFQEKGIRVVAVGNGEAACRKVPEVRPDIVLADVFMPVRNGYEVCEFVKQDPEFAETPVILLVGAFDPLDEKEAARVGANGVLKKPFVPPDPLISLVSSLLGKDMPAEPEGQAPPAPEHPELRNVQYTTPRPEPPHPPQEFAFGSDGDDAIEPAATSSAPMATPAMNAPREVENIDDDELGPENAWAQRRKAMDYEIDAADSADLVERLAGTKSGREKTPLEEGDEILASNKHLPFGGANVPETPPARKWADFLKAKAENAASAPAEPPAEAPVAPEPPAPAESYSYDATPPDLDTPSSKAEIAGELAPSELLSSGDDVIPFRSPSKSEAENNSPEEGAEQPAVESEQGSNVFEISAAPESESQELEIESSAPAPNWFQAASASSSKAPVSEPEPSITPTANGGQEIASSGSTAEVTYGAATEEVESSVVEEDAAPATSMEEVAANSPKADDGLVDDMVARVISKLEPQLHQALKDGVLKPLVQELLNEKRGKK